MIKKIQRRSFAVCVNNTGYRASLETGKLHQLVPDRDAEKHGLIRVIDESGEDYGSSADRFFTLPVPERLEKALQKVSSPQKAIRKSHLARKSRTRTAAKK